MGYVCHLKHFLHKIIAELLIYACKHHSVAFTIVWCRKMCVIHQQIIKKKKKKKKLKIWKQTCFLYILCHMSQKQHGDQITKWTFKGFFQTFSEKGHPLLLGTARRKYTLKTSLKQTQNNTKQTQHKQNLAMIYLTFIFQGAMHEYLVHVHWKMKVMSCLILIGDQVTLILLAKSNIQFYT